tara:strand:- start:17551 stop:18153 length:603 start_codon:yes stop_codon:yes gene_type:complete
MNSFNKKTKVSASTDYINRVNWLEQSNAAKYERIKALEADNLELTEMAARGCSPDEHKINVFIGQLKAEKAMLRKECDDLKAQLQEPVTLAIEVVKLKSLRMDDAKRSDLLRQEFVLEQRKVHAIQLAHRVERQALLAQLEVAKCQAKSSPQEPEYDSSVLSGDNKADIALASIMAATGQTAIRWISVATAVASGFYCMV